MAIYGSTYGSTYGGIPPGVPDHVELALGRRVDRYCGGTIFEWLIRTAAERWQRVANVTHGVGQVLDLDKAFGVQLDSIGFLVVFERPTGFADIRYKRWIEIAILTNNASGLAGELQAVGHAMESVGSPNKSRWDPVYPRGWVLHMPDLPEDEIGAAVAALQRTTAGGVDGRLVVYKTSGYLGFDEDVDPAALPFADDADMLHPVGGGVIAADYVIRGQ